MNALLDVTRGYDILPFDVATDYCINSLYHVTYEPTDIASSLLKSYWGSLQE